MPANPHKVSFSRPFQSNSVEWRSLSQRTIEPKQRANSHRRPAVEEEDMQHQQLFHTICVGTSNAFSLPCPQNVYWFVLEESVIDLFKNEGQLEDGKLRKTHEIVKSLLDSDFGVFVYDRFKSQLLPKAMTIIKSKVDENNYLATLESAWEVFFGKILPALGCMLHQIESLKTISIRKASMVAFRDHILITGPLEEKLRQERNIPRKLNDTIVQMVLVVQDVFECFPPSKNKLEMERICALVVSPYLGYNGLYLNNDNQSPVVQSNEPELVSSIKFKSLESDRLKPIVTLRSSRVPLRKVSLQPVMEKTSHNSLNYLMARIYKFVASQRVHFKSQQ